VGLKQLRFTQFRVTYRFPGMPVSC